MTREQETQRNAMYTSRPVEQVKEMLTQGARPKVIYEGLVGATFTTATHRSLKPTREIYNPDPYRLPSAREYCEGIQKSTRGNVVTLF